MCVHLRLMKFIVLFRERKRFRSVRHINKSSFTGTKHASGDNDN